MERALDLSRQSLASLAQLPRDVARHAERDGEPYALSLAQNRLASLSDIHVFRHVVQLDVSGNQLTSLEGVDALGQLESLNAARNSLTHVDTIASLTQLRVLNVSENKLTQLDALRSLKSLVAVDASYNRIVKWPQLSQLTRLESVELSNNQLEAFPVGVAARMFPPSLRRLSLVKNQINELCGIAALGMFLQHLETIKMDNNPATQRVLRDGGCLDFLWVNLFASVAFAKGAGVRRDDFVVPAEIVEAVEDAVGRGDEAILNQFVLMGAVPTRGVSSGTYYPQPIAPPQHSASLYHEDASPQSIPNSRAKVNEISRPFVAETAPPDHRSVPAGNADGLSKESKMEMWKRVMEERKAQEKRDRATVVDRDITPPPPPPAPTLASTRSPPPPAAPIPVSKPIAMESKIRAPDGLPPSSVTGAPSRREAASGSGSKSSNPPINALTAQVKTLTDQLASVRKYVNVWIKREQLTRVAAATLLQRFTRRRQWVRHLSTLVHRSRERRHNEYGVVPSSSTRLAFQVVPPNQRHLHIYAMAIQRHIRGWLTRFRISRFLYYSGAAVRIQRAWRRRRSDRIALKRELRLRATANDTETTKSLVNTVASLACDVRQLQRVFVVQEQVLARQWQELAYYKRLVETVNLPSIIKIQSLWRGYAVRRDTSVCCRSRPSKLAGQEATPRDREIAALRAELDALKQVVQRLVEERDP